MATDLECQSPPLAAENVRHRARVAVDYYKQQVLSANNRSSSPGEQPDESAYQRNALHKTASRDFRNSQFSQGSAFHRANISNGVSDRGFTEKFPANRQRATVHGLRGKERSWLQSRQTGDGFSHTPSSVGRQDRGFESPRNEVTPDCRTPDHSSTKKRLFQPIYRSNSDLELDNLEHNVEDSPPQIMPLRREYGSTNSIDILANNNNSESFFAMLKDYHAENLDQRSPAPPKIQELLRVKYDLEHGPPAPRGRSNSGSAAGHRMANGSAVLDRDTNESSSSSQSSRPKTKSKPHKDRKVRAKSITGEGSSGIFKKLRGSKPDSGGQDVTNKAMSDSTAAEIDPKSDEKLRRKAFVHFDCQSLGVNLREIIQNKNSGFKRRNTTTGASAASANRNSIPNCREDPDILSETDDGDNKSSDMVLSCPFFRNELGGEEERMICLAQATAHRNAPTSNSSVYKNTVSYVRHPSCSGVAILDCSASPLTNQPLSPIVSHKGYVMEYVDHGASYYRHFFNGYDHQNYFGLDENLGPVAVSIRRERLDERDNNNGRADYGQYQYRIICRNSELTALRGAILEDAIPSSSRLSSSRGVPFKDVLEYTLPELQLSCLRQATASPKTAEQLIKLDEQGISSTYKVGIMYCRAGQSSEEEMYNNESASPAFEEFLNCIGERVRLKGFEKYRAQLDNKTDSTGTHSLFAKHGDNEVMFHVSTMLPYTANNKQQLLRKRHIGNDIVTVVFQEQGALPFTPKAVRSHFQHVFIIVKVHNSNTDNVRYSVAVSRSKDVPPFGPPIPEGATFTKSQEFADFLLAKVVNGENAVHRSEKFIAMATRTRQEYLKDLATNHVTTTTLDSGSKLSKFGLGSGRKKERTKQKVTPDLFARGAVTWPVQVEDFGWSMQIDCQLGIAMETIAIVEELSKDVVFTIPSDRVLGWTQHGTSLRLYYDHGECVMLKSRFNDIEEVNEIISRLAAVTTGSETFEINLKRNGLGQLGFHVHPDGLITDVEPYSFAWQAGLRQSSQLVEICKIAVATLTHEQMVDLLRTSAIVKVVVIPPNDDGTPRGSVSNLCSPNSSLSGTLSSDRSWSSSLTSMSSTHSSLTLPVKSRYGPRVSKKPPLSKNTLMTQSSHYPQSDLVLSSNRRSDETQNSHDSSEGYSTRQGLSDSFSSSGEERHSRNSSHDSGDGPPTASRQWVGRTGNLASSQQVSSNKNNWYLENQSEGSSHGTSGYYSSSDSNYITMSHGGGGALMSGRSGRITGDHHGDRPGAPSTGNINQELMKQSQNTKFLLSQGKQSPQGIVTDFPVSSDQLPSNSSGSSHALSTGPSLRNGPNSNKERFFMDPQRYQDKDEFSAFKKRPEFHMSNSKGRPGANYKRSHLDVSPISSNSSSPRSSNRNLSGMSSEESLTTRLRPGVTTNSRPAPASAPTPQGKPSAGVTSSVQEDLKRLINPDVSEVEITHYASPPRPGRLQRALSEESLHSFKAASSNLNLETIGGTDVIFTSALQNYLSQLPPHKLQELIAQQRLSPHMIAELTRRPISARSTDSPSFPLPDTASGIEWSSLVDVATKAIEAGRDSSSTPAKTARNQGEYTTLEAGPVVRDISADRASSRTTWRSVATNPQQRIEELEQRVQHLEQQLEQERQENQEMESEVQELRKDNLRLQDESQVAAAQLRKFTEWFFNTIDRQ